MQLKKHSARLKYAVLLLMALFLLSNRGFRTLIRNSLEYRRLKNQKVKFEAEKIRLETRLRTMKEPGRIEHMARKELGLVRPDEIEYRFPPPK
ncbi:MAG: hypothetical protein A2X28_06895 [Elusimicrobia bacterium GWA2_56_46]|nr:MAG: hypothetical protein A2X28_06895 [Elusimicrobia bacterium GWA2_56_46]OGR54822.1 MAG: hypothetical protein A2X39_11095 [Elusimicrobia bacterium GWC2_56_31]HBB66398.1 hypothetical protein [Elusimicrobiota bacterium]HBW23386.1 hypothetical protein [Elusimicrobiota bacterium]